MKSIHISCKSVSLKMAARDWGEMRHMGRTTAVTIEQAQRPGRNFV